MAKTSEVSCFSWFISLMDSTDLFSYTDSKENIKKLKVKVNEVQYLTCEERIVVDFDYLDEPFGDARGLLSGFCGILACDCTLFPIHYMLTNVLFFKPKFFFKTTESVARQHVYKSIGKKWAANRLNLWSASEDPLKSRAEIIHNVPDGIPPDQWISFVDYQYKDSTKEMRKRNAENRKKQKIPHTGGSKANATRRAEMIAQTGQMPGRAQIYIATHKNEDGVYVNEEVKEICLKLAIVLGCSRVPHHLVTIWFYMIDILVMSCLLFLLATWDENFRKSSNIGWTTKPRLETGGRVKEKIELALSESTIDESQISPNDAVGKVLGKEHSGRVRCLGLGPVPSKVFKQVRPRFGGTSSSSIEGSCSSQCQHNHNQMMNAHNQMMNAFKAYMIMKEGTLPEQFVGFFDSPSTISPTTPSDADSGPFLPMDARRSCGDSNSRGNH
ncbi:uncharacterized protein LOC107765149 [Nicotiana tabacum]|uniref:Uncharacterized protein LOC107765149 n=1 Tax=Nicotiana tabacum TaxID=4097 RepID=A0AC58SU66_TOBAC